MLLAKSKGIEAVRALIASRSHMDEFTTFDELYEFNTEKDLSGNPPQILYREIMNTNRDEYIYVIETIFINE